MGIPLQAVARALATASILLFSANAETLAQPRFSLSWPTPNAAYFKGMGLSGFIQKTGPDKPITSGAYGCVRNNGYKFHEGLDLFPVKRDGRGRAEDSVFAAMDGIVRHANRTSSHSGYGKYVVLEHPSVKPALYTLYGHLAEINEKIKPGTSVRVASPLGKMGNTSSGYRIPLNRSHLHFEVGLRLSDSFQSWYQGKSFKTPNRHGNFSGFNLVGLNPLDFYDNYRRKSMASPLDYLKKKKVVAKIRVRSSRTPDFVKRYPSLSISPEPNKSVDAWDASFAAHGLPIRIEPSKWGFPKDKSPFRVLSYDESADSASMKCRRIIMAQGKKLVLAEQLKVYLEILFRL